MKVNRGIFKRRVAPFLISSTMLGNLVGCGKKTDEVLIKEPLHLSDTKNIYEIVNNDAEYFESLEVNDYTLILYGEKDYSKHCMPNEFKNYVKEENITYDDIRNTLNSNVNITDDIKTILLNGIDNLEKNGVKINLDLLKHNLKNLKVETLDSIKSNETIIAAKFDPYQCKLILDLNLLQLYDFNYTICHEVLGHGSTEAFIPDNGGIYFSTSIPFGMDDEDKTIMYGSLGYSFHEAIAEYIAIKSTNTKMDNNGLNGLYSHSMYMLLLTCEALDISVEDYINNGMKLVINKSIENDVKEYCSAINYFDLKNCYMIGYNIDYNADQFIYLFYDYCKLIIEKDETLTEEQLIEMLDSYKDYIIPFDYYGDNCIITGTAENPQAIDLDELKIACLEVYKETRKVK